MAGFDPSLLNNVTRKYFDSAMRNQIYKTTLLLNYIQAESNVRDAAGPAIQWTETVKRHHSTGITGGYAVMANQPKNPTQQMELAPAKYYAAMAISNDELRFNAGPKDLVKLIDILGVQVENATNTLHEDIGTGVYGDGTKIDDFQTVVGLEAAITGTTGTYAGVNRATAGNEYWRAYVDTSSHTLANLVDPDSTSYLPDIMTKAWIGSRLTRTPNLIITTPTIYTMYEQIARSQIRSTNVMGDVGFGDLEFKNGVRLRFDDFCPAYKMYFLNLADWEWYVYPGMNFQMAPEGWLSALVNGQDAQVAYMFFQGQLICRHPRGQGKINSIGAS